MRLNSEQEELFRHLSQSSVQMDQVMLHWRRNVANQSGQKENRVSAAQYQHATMSIMRAWMRRMAMMSGEMSLCSSHQCVMLT